MGAVVVSIVEIDRVRGPDLERFWKILPKTEQAEADRVADRRALVCARALVRLALSAEVPDVAPTAWTFERDDAGRPHATDPVAPMFNLSHTDGLAACAVSAAPVGLDIEPLARGPALLDTVVRAFAPAEVAALRSLPEADQLRRAVELWTVKEAYLKGLGTGIGRRLGSFGVTPRGDGLWTVDEESRWSVTVHEHESFLLAVATVGRPTIVFRDALMYALP